MLISLCLCLMNNQGPLHWHSFLPLEILSNFEVIRVVEESSLIRIYLDESFKAEGIRYSKEFLRLITRRCFSNAIQTIDSFHIQKLACDALQEMRIIHRWNTTYVETIAKKTGGARRPLIYIPVQNSVVKVLFSVKVLALP